MKKLIFILSGIFLLFSCDTKDCCVLPPELSEFHGEWKLVKVINGFAQTELEGDEIGFEESIYFDAEAKTFTRKRSDSAEEKSRLEKGTEGGQDALILLDENMYHWYHFETIDDKPYLVLYQKSYLGAVLADGSDYYYLKQ